MIGQIRSSNRGGYKIHLTFNDGSEKTLDFRPWLKKGPVFKPLEKLEYFKRFFLDGGTVAWPNGADMAPEVLYGADVVQLTRKRKPPRRRSA
ncbi:MAG: DUF2442 domain-containing protein [Gemmatimonadaceae bacterium]